MEKLLFIHGGEKIKEDEEKNLYTDGSYSSEVWERYKIIAPNIRVVFRKDKNIYSKAEAQKKFQPLNNDIIFYEAIDKKSNIKAFLSIRNEINNRKMIKKLVLESDYIIARVPSGISYYAIKIANKYNKKLLVEVVGCPFDCMWNHSIKGKILAIPEYLRLKYYMGKVLNAIYVSEKFLQKRYPNKGNNIGCSDVVLKECSKNVLEARIKKIRTLKKDTSQKIIFGTCGAIDIKTKGHKYMFKSIKELKKLGYSNIEYQLVGNGNKKRLEKLAQRYNIQENVSFLGPIKHDIIFDWLDKIDVYVQPSCQEGLCRALIEAMSRACPCIASDAGGNPELISKELIFQKKNYKELTNKIKQLLNSNLEDIAKINFLNAQKYTKDLLDKKRVEFYKKFLKQDI